MEIQETGDTFLLSKGNITKTGNTPLPYKTKIVGKCKGNRKERKGTLDEPQSY
jgi:hypothetical protein